MKTLTAGVQVALQQAMAAAGLATYDGPLIIGVSAGPDSLVLLDVLARLLPEERLIAAHLDHGLRPTSAQEAEHVRAAAAARGLRYHVARLDVAAVAREQRLSLEEAGRAARYDYLAGVARAAGAGAVVVGHHADDQAETILMHLLRGAGVAGLRGMPAAGALPGHPQLWLLRPLLGVSRAAIERYCADTGLTVLEDESNRDPAFFRNRLRHELLPLLERYSPGIRARLLNLADILTAEDELLSQAEDEAWREIADTTTRRVRLNRAAWQAQPLALRRRLLRRAVAMADPVLRDLSFQTIEDARRIAETSPTGARATLPQALSLVVGYQTLEIGPGVQEQTDEWPQLPSGESMPLAVPGRARLAGGWWLTAEYVEGPSLAHVEANRDPWVAYVAPADEALVVRPRLPGERIRPLGLGGATKLKEVMIDRKIPAPARARWPIVATADHALWLVGHVLDERARVRETSERVIWLHCLRDEVG